MDVKVRIQRELETNFANIPTLCLRQWSRILLLEEIPLIKRSVQKVFANHKRSSKFQSDRSCFNSDGRGALNHACDNNHLLKGPF